MPIEIADMSSSSLTQAPINLQELIQSLQNTKREIKAEVRKAKKEATRTLNQELKEEHAYIMRLIKKHNANVEQFDQDNNVVEFVKRLREIHIEKKALKIIQKYYTGK